MLSETLKKVQVKMKDYNSIEGHTIEVQNYHTRLGTNPMQNKNSIEAQSGFAMSSI